MSNDERLAYMANQIARNFAQMGDDRAASATADHIASFWDPRMKARIVAMCESGGVGLTPVAAQAIASLRDQGKPPAQTAATRFNAVDEAGHSDAG